MSSWSRIRHSTKELASQLLVFKARQASLQDKQTSGQVTLLRYIIFSRTLKIMLTLQNINLLQVFYFSSKELGKNTCMLSGWVESKVVSRQCWAKTFWRGASVDLLSSSASLTPASCVRWFFSLFSPFLNKHVWARMSKWEKSCPPLVNNRSNWKNFTNKKRLNRQKSHLMLQFPLQVHDPGYFYAVFFNSSTSFPGPGFVSSKLTVHEISRNIQDFSSLTNNDSIVISQFSIVVHYIVRNRFLLFHKSSFSTKTDRSSSGMDWARWCPGAIATSSCLEGLGGCSWRLLIDAWLSRLYHGICSWVCS